MEKFIAEASWIIPLLLLVVEYLIGVSKLKSNSTLELVVNVLKGFVELISKKEE